MFESFKQRQWLLLAKWNQILLLQTEIKKEETAKHVGKYDYYVLKERKKRN